MRTKPSMLDKRYADLRAITLYRLETFLFFFNEGFPSKFLCEGWDAGNFRLWLERKFHVYLKYSGNYIGSTEIVKEKL